MLTQSLPPRLEKLPPVNVPALIVEADGKFAVKVFFKKELKFKVMVYVPEGIAVGDV